jgi:hypothetical protein
MRHHRIALVLGLTALATMGAFGVACSSSNGSNFGSDDGGSDATTGDSGRQDVTDAGDALQGNCEPLHGECDLVLQDCTDGKQCVPDFGPDGGNTTSCQPTTGTQHIKKGYACTPPQQPAQNPCLPGLECVHNRCSPYCCDKDDTPCGTSSPEGIPGVCNLQVTNGKGQTLFNVCTYAAICKPFKLLPCPPGSACYTDDTATYFACSPYARPDGGAPEGAQCNYLNDCVDGTQCIGPPNAGQCTMLCYTGHGNPPFDAGALQMGPGTGGCVSGEQCKTNVGWPSWIGVCGP